ncbi:Cytochrome P467 monooxygenase [Paramyrothecium foliicola]|nr:Cytochrome P467 monooxygenase [Paramyrothecium foliicola]
MRLIKSLLLLPAALVASAPAAAALPPYFVLTGDSTVAASGGWGSGFLSTLTGGASGTNPAQNGATTVSFKSDGHWAKAIKAVKDNASKFQCIVTIQFGHNDQKPEKGISLSQYKQNLITMANEVKAAGGTPILVTSLTRRKFSGNKVSEDLAQQRTATIEAAQAVGAKYLDLNRVSTDYVTKIGETNALKYNKEASDRTHLNAAGIKVFGRIVADLMSSARTDLSSYIKANKAMSDKIAKGQFATGNELLPSWRRTSSGTIEDFTAAIYMTRASAASFDFDLSIDMFKTACKYARSLNLHNIDVCEPSNKSILDTGHDMSRARMWELMRTDLFFGLIHNVSPTFSSKLTGWKVKLPSRPAAEPITAVDTMCLIVGSRFTLMLARFFEISQDYQHDRNAMKESIYEICTEMDNLYDSWEIMQWVEGYKHDDIASWITCQLALTGYTSILFMLFRIIDPGKCPSRVIVTDHHLPTDDMARKASRQILIIYQNLTWLWNSASGDPNHVLTYFVIFSAFFIVYSGLGKGEQLPEVNPKRRLELTNIPRLRHFSKHSMRILIDSASHVLKKPHRLFCEWGEVIMLPPSSVDAIRSDRRFDFATTASEDSHGYLPGFDGLSEDHIVSKVVTRYLTKALTKLTSPLSDEAAIVIQQVMTDSHVEWHTFNVQQDIMSIVSRMSSRVFMGEKLCRDENWNKASSEYTLNVFKAVAVLGEWPRWLRPWVHWFLPSCQKVRSSLTLARKYLEPHIEQREKVKAEALARGDKAPFDDSIEWFRQLGSKRPAADLQIFLSLVAIHTTTDLLSEVLINIAANPEVIQPLREEIIRVLTAEGLKKTALYDLRLMDSICKETQRLKPVILAWRRLALEDVTLPDGMTIKKGQKLAVGLTHMWSEEHYKDALKFDPYRFLRMRETPGEDHMAHLVSTSPDHLGFGHGVHACPGRFFASNEVKIALCHLLLKYDWKLPDGPKPQPISSGMSFNTNPNAKLLIRRRKEEIDFNGLQS